MQSISTWKHLFYRLKEYSLNSVQLQAFGQLWFLGSEKSQGVCLSPGPDPGHCGNGRTPSCTGGETSGWSHRSRKEKST